MTKGKLIVSQMGSNLKVKVKETHGGDDFKPKPPAGVGDCGTAEAKGKQDRERLV